MIVRNAPYSLCSRVKSEYIEKIMLSLKFLLLPYPKEASFYSLCKSLSALQFLRNQGIGLKKSYQCLL